MGAEIRSQRSERISIQSCYNAGIRLCAVLKGHSLAPVDGSGRSSFRRSLVHLLLVRTGEFVFQRFRFLPQPQQLLRSAKATRKTSLSTRVELAIAADITRSITSWSIILITFYFGTTSCPLSPDSTSSGERVWGRD